MTHLVLACGYQSKGEKLSAVRGEHDEGYRRRIGSQLNVTEARHRLARKISFGQRGGLLQHYREGMEDQLGALGLTLNAVVLFDSLYIDAAPR